MKKIFITGGAGFIGSNAAYYFYKKKWQVYIFDNLSRKGTFFNIKWLKKNFGWAPSISPEIGIKKLMSWVYNNKKLISQALA